VCNLLLINIVDVVIYDFFIGRELNPRVGPVDLKFFCELRPGLIGWIMLDLSFVAEVLANGQFPSAALLLVTAFHALYVADALYHEVVCTRSLMCDIIILIFSIFCDYMFGIIKRVSAVFKRLTLR